MGNKAMPKNRSQTQRNQDVGAIAATFQETSPEASQREMLGFLAPVYDPLGVASLV